MGGVKDEWIRTEERGWGEIDKLVCSDCVNEPDLWRLAGPGSPGQCDYCEQDGNPVLPVAAIQEVLYQVVHAYYAEPTQAGTPYDEGSFLVEPFDTAEMLAHHLGFEPQPELLEDIVQSDVVGSWVPAADGHWASSHDHQVKIGSWSNFSHVVKHQTRFHFQRVVDDHTSQEIGVAHMLEVVAQELTPLIRDVPSGTTVFRSRHLTEDEIRAMDAAVMGPPPEERATAGRMNPAGIPYFYGSLDAQTALSEIGAPEAGKAPTAACFSVNRPLRVVDLTHLPSKPSVFEIDQKEAREKAIFLSAFVESITKPVAKDGREHIEYVPSQVVCEYLAQAVRDENGRPLDGLLFPSSVHPGGVNLVVFPAGQGFESSRFSSLTYGGAA